LASPTRRAERAARCTMSAARAADTSAEAIQSQIMGAALSEMRRRRETGRRRTTAFVATPTGAGAFLPGSTH
jgi:hypothetical protein